MPTITYIEFDGTAHRVDVPAGNTVMQGAFDNNLPGIDADCGGECACATCHVYIEPEWIDAVGSVRAGSAEESMLSFAAEGASNSRLACQIDVTPELDGLVLRMPEGQH